MRGELDWIVMKALEKDRNRRYETASGFAADIEPICTTSRCTQPPSAAYRFRKFAGRNKASLAAMAAAPRWRWSWDLSSAPRVSCSPTSTPICPKQ